jgi:hypothetical protein
VIDIPYVSRVNLSAEERVCYDPFGGIMVLERLTGLQAKDIEAALRRAARRHNANISAVDSVGAATVFTIKQPDLYQSLLAAEIRFAALLPCRIAAYNDEDGLRLTAASMVDFARGFGNAKVLSLAAGADALLNEILEEAARPATLTAGHAESGFGATEDQVNMRGALPQRIDKRGSKLEEIAGTGEHDSPGG